MTQFGKCDICRQRKVKCDEVHPVCGACSKGQRPCKYSRAYRFTADQKRLEGKFQQDSGQGPNEIGEWSPLEDPDYHGEQSGGAAGGGGVLTLRSLRPAETGGGSFRTFVTGKPPQSKSKSPELVVHEERNGPGYWGAMRLSLLKEPSSAASRLLSRCARLSESLSEGRDTPWVMGEWMGLAVHRIGNVKVIDHALEYFISATVAYNNRDNKNFSAMDIARMQAIRSIRGALVTEGLRGLARDDLLIAILIVHSCEILQHASEGGLHVHSTGLVNLLQRATRDGRECSEAVQRIFFSCIALDLHPAVMEGRDQIFDTPGWHAQPLPYFFCTNPTVSRVSLATLRTYIKLACLRLPTLVRLVRRARQEPLNLIARKSAIDMAAMLWSNDAEVFVEKLLDLGLLTVVPTTRTDFIDAVPASFAFSSYVVHCALVHYWMARVVTAGLLLALHDLQPPMAVVVGEKPVDPAEVAEQDVLAAERIAMSTEYGVERHAGLPIISARFLAVLQWAFGSWSRLKRRSADGNGATSSEGEEAARASRMEAWCLSTRNEIGSWLGVPPLGSMQMEWLVMIYEGAVMPGGPN